MVVRVRRARRASPGHVLACALSSLLAASASAETTRASPRMAAAASATLPPSAATAIEGPTVMVLGRDASATLRFSLPRSAHITAHANVGTLGALKRVAGQRWQVQYTPPEQKYPQVAIIALISDDDALVAWTRISLHGLAHVEIRSDPEVAVEVRVGAATFGPVQTDHEGRAEIPVVVPPGTLDAISIATDALGNRRQQPIPIKVPEFQRLLSVCSSTDGRGFWVFAVDKNGAPQPSAALAAEGVPVRVQGIEPRGPGVYRVAFQIPDSMRAGDAATLTTSLRDAPASQQACQMRVPLERPDRIDLQTATLGHEAGDAEPVHVHVKAHYPGVREPEASELSFEVSVGRVEPAHARANVPLDVLWYLPPTFGDLTEARITASVDDVSAVRSIALHDPNASAQGSSARKHGSGLIIGARAGALTNFGRIAAPLALLQVGHTLPFIGERLRLVFEAGYYQSQRRELSFDLREHVDTRVRGMPLLLRVEYVFNVDDFELWPMAGAGVLLAVSDVTSTSTGRAHASVVTPLLAAGAGASVGLGPGRANLELGYVDARVSTSSVTGNAAGFFATLGYRLML